MIPASRLYNKMRLTSVLVANILRGTRIYSSHSSSKISVKRKRHHSAIDTKNEVEILKAQLRFGVCHKTFRKVSEYVEQTVEDEPEIPYNPLREIYSASFQPENGKIYDKRPFRMKCQKGKTYFWCLCGQSKNQPLCDGTHRSPYLNIKLRPIKFTVTEDKEYWLCNCKQTSNRPFCDGTHKREDIQAAIK